MPCDCNNHATLCESETGVCDDCQHNTAGMFIMIISAKNCPDTKLEQSSHSDWKTWKMGRHFAVREMSGNFDQTGKVRENRTKYCKTAGISDKCYWLFLHVLFNEFVYYLLNLMEFSG